MIVRSLNPFPLFPSMPLARSKPNSTSSYKYPRKDVVLNSLIPPRNGRRVFRLAIAQMPEMQSNHVSAMVDVSFVSPPQKKNIQNQRKLRGPGVMGDVCLRLATTLLSPFRAGI